MAQVASRFLFLESSFREQWLSGIGLRLAQRDVQIPVSRVKAIELSPKSMLFS